MAFDQAIADKICERIAQGEPLKPICREEGMPCWKTVYNWIKTVPEFAADMEFARQLGAHAISDETLEIADDGRNDWMVSNDEDNPGYKLNGEHVQRSKLRIHTRQQLAAKWHPKAYGDKLELAGNAEAPLQVVVQRLTDGK